MGGGSRNRLARNISSDTLDSNTETRAGPGMVRPRPLVLGNLDNPKGSGVKRFMNEPQDVVRDYLNGLQRDPLGSAAP